MDILAVGQQAHFSYNGTVYLIKRVEENYYIASCSECGAEQISGETIEQTQQKFKESLETPKNTINLEELNRVSNKYQQLRLEYKRVKEELEYWERKYKELKDEN
mgnify:CR=1 FL=1